LPEISGSAYNIEEKTTMKMTYETLTGKTLTETLSYIGSQVRSMEKGTFVKNLAKAIVRLKRDDSEDAKELGDVTEFCEKKFNFDPRKGAFQGLYEAIRVWEHVIDKEVPCEESRFDSVVVNAITQLSAILSLDKFKGVREEGITIFCEEKKPLVPLMNLKKTVNKPKDEKPKDEKPKDEEPKGEEPEISGNEPLTVVPTSGGAEGEIVIPADGWALTAPLHNRIAQDITFAADNGHDGYLEQVEESLNALTQLIQDSRQGSQPKSKAS
jgi:hypothetical protein